MASGIQYETLVRGAAHLASGRPVPRGGDPAKLGRAEVPEDDLPSARAAAGYAMAIFLSRLRTAPWWEQIPGETRARLPDFVRRAVDASSAEQLLAAVSEFQSRVLLLYFDLDDTVELKPSLHG